MQPFAAYFGLPFQAREVVPVEVSVRLIRPKDQQALDELRQQELMMKRHIRTPVLK